jgi:hypothetical protein
MKIRPVEAELLSADECSDGRRDGRKFMAKPIVAFRDFTNAPKIGGNIGRTNNPYLCYSYRPFSYMPYLTNKMHSLKCNKTDHKTDLC